MPLPHGLRWWELLPEVVLGLGLTFFAVTEWSAARSAFKSTTAIALMGATALAWVLGRLLLARFTNRPGPRLVLFSLAAAGILAVVVLPAYDDTTVVESLPTASASPPTSQPPATGAGDDPPSTTSTTAAPQPVALRMAEITGIDHRAEGTAVVYEQPDGSLVVGLEEIDIQPGPDYDVYVVPGAAQESIGAGVRLDDLRGNKGTQYYDVPAEADLTVGAWTVLVWCETFDVPVAGATPA